MPHRALFLSFLLLFFSSCALFLDEAKFVGIWKWSSLDYINAAANSNTVIFRSDGRADMWSVNTFINYGWTLSNGMLVLYAGSARGYRENILTYAFDDGDRMNWTGVTPQTNVRYYLVRIPENSFE